MVHKVAPGAHVVYVDHDPMVAAYARELLVADGSTAVITADVREPDAGLNDPAISYVGVWGAEDPVAADSDGSRGLYCGVGRRP